MFAAISGEHIRDSAGLTVADKSCMINTLPRTRPQTHALPGWLVAEVYCWGNNRRLGER